MDVRSGRRIVPRDSFLLPESGNSRAAKPLCKSRKTLCPGIPLTETQGGLSRVSGNSAIKGTGAITLKGYHTCYGHMSALMVNLPRLLILINPIHLKPCRNIIRQLAPS